MFPTDRKEILRTSTKRGVVKRNSEFLLGIKSGVIVLLTIFDLSWTSFQNNSIMRIPTIGIT